ncbi:hypothetical protein [Yeosuana marina]|uniref:hypothetical protein n=1 Tax=Yeosuana marina TaxID=1565536 RepID=UPI0014235279|nr:hypothetical protein [Yeosuana marina]
MPLLKIAEQLPTESIYLQTDKDIYETEEDIWFGATILNSQSLEHQSISEIFYFDVLDENKSTVFSEKYPIENGVVNGHFYLSDTISPGNYILTGYTKNSINNSVKNYNTYKPIKIKKTIIPKILATYDLVKKSEEEFNLKLSVLRRSGIESGIIKLKLKAFNGYRNTILEKSETDSLGNSILSFKLYKDKIYSNFILEAKTGDKVIENIPLNLDYRKDSLNVSFFPEGGNLLANVNQKVGFEITSSHLKGAKYTCLLYENNRIIDTLKTNDDGLGSLNLIPKLENDYSLKVLHTNELFSLPNPLQYGITLHFLGEVNEKYKFNIIKNRKVSGEENIYVRVQSKGTVKWMSKGKLKNKNTIFYVPKNRLSSEITEISVFDKNFNSISSRLFFPNIENRLKIKILNDIDRTYPTKSNLKLRLQILDKDNNPVKGKINVSVYDKLFCNPIDGQSMESFFKINNEIFSNLKYSHKYLNSNENIDLLLLTTETTNYKWNQEERKTNKSELLIKESTYCKVLKKDKNGKLSIAGKVGIIILSAQGLFNAETDSVGNFFIDATFLKQFRGEQIFIKTQDENMVIKILNKNNQDFPSSLLTTNHFIFSDIKKGSDSIQIKKKIQSYSLNSMNLLDEVVIDGKSGRKPKYLSSELTYLGYDGDYVCEEYDVLNCENHKFGYKPKPYEYYYVKESAMSYVKKQYIPTGLTTKGNNPYELNNYIVINSFYPHKEFELSMHSDKNENWEPDYRKTLFWKTNIQTDDNGIITLDYSTSDIRGEFICEIDAFSSNKGLFGYNSFGFFVF